MPEARKYEQHKAGIKQLIIKKVESSTIDNKDVKPVTKNRIREMDVIPNSSFRQVAN